MQSTRVQDRHRVISSYVPTGAKEERRECMHVASSVATNYSMLGKVGSLGEWEGGMFEYSTKHTITKTWRGAI